jgi:hypothetical protein
LKYSADSVNEATGGQRQVFPARRWSTLVVISAMSVLLVVLFLTRWLPVSSDDGTGTEEDALESPLLIWKYPLGDKAYLAQSKTVAGDLLTNGNMDQMGFYWRPPNHWIAGAWFEWFSPQPFNFPEFGDGHERGFYHTFPSSERLQLWANDYAGGLMQSASVTPCVYYQFEAYGQSRPGSDNPPPVAVASHMRVGIEPFGWKSGRTITHYDPRLEPDQFPSTVIWSPEATHNFEFAPYRVTAEALSDTLTVILYSYPEVNVEGGVIWNDTIWDTASLVQVPRPAGTLLDGADIPEPDRFIGTVTATVVPGQAVVAWETAGEAYTQLLYRVGNKTRPISATTLLVHSRYLPVIGYDLIPESMRATPPDYTPVRQHTVVLSGLPQDYSLTFVALSRRLGEGACITSASPLMRVESSGESPEPLAPPAGGD